jgi:hypothetical protein
MTSGRKRLLRAAILLPLFLGWACGLTALEERRMAASTIAPSAVPAPLFVDSDRLFADVRALSAPAMEGRLTGSEGGRRARAFILERMRTTGLEPVNGSYEQPFAFTRRSLRGLLTPGRAYVTEFPEAVNAFGAIRGTSAPDEWLLLTAHYDHFGLRDDALHPGADDNASGVAALLAAMEYFTANPPRRSMLFVAFDAEEQGVRGASHFVEHSPIDLSRVRLLVNADMVSRGDDGVIVASGTDGDDALRDLVTRAAAGRALSVRFGHDRPLYLAGLVADWSQSSDHGPFIDAGVRTLYYGVEDHADYHAPGDTADKIPRTFFAESASLIVNTLREADAVP